MAGKFNYVKYFFHGFSKMAGKLSTEKELLTWIIVLSTQVTKSERTKSEKILQKILCQLC